MAIKANLVVDQGTSFSATIDLTDASGVVFNLTGYTVAAQMRKNYASSTAVNFTSSHTGVNGKINLTLLPNTTNALSPGRYLYDVEITSSGGAVTRVVEGIVTVTPGITRI
jgi:hypothetical protein